MTTSIRPARTTPVAGTDALLATLRDALEAHAQDDGDPHGGTPAGRRLLGLAAAARAAAADLGADPGTTLTAGPGVVVLRDLVAATRLLERAVAGRLAADHGASRTRETPTLAA